jgi:hypothetical protein
MRIINPFAFSSGSVNLGSRDFASASSQYFSRSSSATVETGDVDFWVSCWFKADSASANMTMIGKWAGTPGREYLLRWNIAFTGFVDWFVRNAGDTANFNVTAGSSLSTGTWYHTFAYHDASANQIGVALDGGSFSTTSLSGGVNVAGEDFQVGAADSSGFFDGKLLNVAFGKPPSTPTWADLRDALYNSGNALYWEDISGANRTAWGLTSGNGVWYPLNETSAGDDAIDNVAGLTLTDVNTVGVSADVP